MKRNTRWTLLFTSAAAVSLMLWDLTPQVASKVGKSGRSARHKTTHRANTLPSIVQDAQQRKLPPQGRVSTGGEEPDAESDPDLPAFMLGLVDKEEYLARRGEYIAMMRGLEDENAGELRAEAIEMLNRQEGPKKGLKGERILPGVAPLISSTEWLPLGPAPIPNGFLSGRSDPNSGRTISIAVHPNNPDIVYVGTAQGGLYRSLNGGANWTQLMDVENAATPGTGTSLAIGAVAIDPASPTTVFVGTGEASFVADSFIGRGVFRIRNAETTPVVEGPFGLSQFNNRAVGEILVADTDPTTPGSETLFVCTAQATGSNPDSPPSPIIAPPVGIFRSTNAQDAIPTFTKLTIQGLPSQNRNMIDMAFEPGNPNVLLVTVLTTTINGGGIYRTTNALSATPNFTRTLVIDNQRAELAINKLDPDGDGPASPIVTVLAATGENAPRSAPSPAPAGSCPGAQQGLVRRSTDGGRTWEGCPGGICGAPVPGINFIAGSQGFCHPQCSYDIAIALHANNLIMLLGGSRRDICSDKMKRSVDGATFARDDIGLHPDTHAIEFAPSDASVVYTGNDGGIWKSNDAGENWISLNNMDFSATQFQDIALHPFDRFFMIGGTQDNGTNFLQPDGTWRQADTGDGGYALIDQNAGDTTNVTMYHTYLNSRNAFLGYSRVFSVNQALNEDDWEFRNCTVTGIRCADNVLFYAPMDLGPDTADSEGVSSTVYFGSDRLYRSKDRGTTMQLVSQGPLSPLPSPPNPAGIGVMITALDIAPQNDNVRIVGLRDGSVFATTTGSSPLRDITRNEFPIKPATRVAVDPTNPNTVYVSFGGFGVPNGQHVWKTTNLAGLAAGSVSPAEGWQPVGSGIPDIPVDVVVVDPQNANTIYAGTDVGVFRSIDGGESWSAFSTGLPRVAVFDLEIADAQRILRAATHGRGVSEIQLPGQQLAVIRNARVALVEESCPPLNNVIDPSERVSVALTLQNVGPASASNLTATLLPTGGVTAPSGSQAITLPGTQSYGAVAPGETATRTFAFTADAACGSTITLTFQLSDGMNNQGTVFFTFALGVKVNTATTFAENFDDETSPALPVGWSTLATGPGGKPWTTASFFFDTAPNSAATVADVPGNVTTCTGGQGGADLTSEPIPIPTPPAEGINGSVQLRFKKSFNFEPDFDGGLLEISINDGAFQDIIAAGGSFVSGGYNGTLQVDPVNPLSGRPAWTGNGNTTTTTVVNLPGSAIGQTVRFKWRTGYDSCFVPLFGGMRIDTISVAGSSSVCNTCCTLSCPSNITVPNDPGECGAIVNYPAPTFIGDCGTVTVSQASGTFFPVGITKVTVTGTRLDGSSDSCSFTVTVNDAERPTLIAPPDINISNEPGQCGATLNPGTATAKDNCPGATVNGVRSDAMALNALYPVGATTITWTATDAHGNTSMPWSVQTVIVNDTENPVVSCPASVTVDATSAAGAVATFSNPMTTDNCPGVTVSCTALTGSMFPIGTTPVTCSATDTSNNIASCSFNVTVRAPLNVKRDVLSQLIALRRTITDRHGRRELGEAIEELTESVNPGLWSDPAHPQTRNGERVFEEEEEAVHKMLELIRERHSTVPDAVLRDFVSRLKQADRVIALVAISDAVGRNGDPNKIAEANRELGKGDSERNAEEAIEHYEKAWALVRLRPRFVKDGMSLEFIKYDRFPRVTELAFPSIRITAEGFGPFKM